MIVTDEKHVALSMIHVSVAQIETIMTQIDSSTVQQNVAQIQWSARQDPSDSAGLIMADTLASPSGHLLPVGIWLIVYTSSPDVMSISCVWLIKVPW